MVQHCAGPAITFHMDQMEVEGVAGVVVSTEADCALCGITVCSAEQLAQHQAGKSHKQREMEVAEVRLRVHLSGFCEERTTAHNLEAALGQFGPIAALSLHTGFAFATFKTAAERDAAVAAGAVPVPSAVGEQSVRIRPARVSKTPRDRKVDRAKEAKQETSALLAATRKIAAANRMTGAGVDSGSGSGSGSLTLESQLGAVASLRSPSDAAQAQHATAVTAVARLVRTRLGDTATVETYGSHVTGLGTAASDVDLTVVVAVEGGDGDGDGGTVVLGSLHDLAASHPQFSTHEVTGGKCPVLTLHHLPTSTTLDVSVNNHLALRNTALQLAYAEMCPLVKLHVHAVRAWLSTTAIRLSGYAVTLAVIADLIARGDLPNLQSRRGGCRGCLATDASLSEANAGDTPNPEHGRPAKRRKQSSAAGVDAAEVGGWDTSFCRCGYLADHTAAPTAALERLASFFDFLAAHCGGATAISIRAGGSLPASDLRCGQTALTIEDPFELTHNLTRSTPKTKVGELQRRALGAAAALRAAGDLSVLFDQPPPSDRKNVAAAGPLRLDEHTLSFSVSADGCTAASLTEEVATVLVGIGVTPTAVDPDGGVVRGTAVRNVWAGSRRARREAARQAAESGVASDGPAIAANPTHPLFDFHVTARDTGEITLWQSAISKLETAQEFAALFKLRVIAACKTSVADSDMACS